MSNFSHITPIFSTPSLSSSLSLNLPKPNDSNGTSFNLDPPRLIPIMSNPLAPLTGYSNPYTSKDIFGKEFITHNGQRIYVEKNQSGVIIN